MLTHTTLLPLGLLILVLFVFGCTRPKPTPETKPETAPETQPEARPDTKPDAPGPVPVALKTAKKMGIASEGIKTRLELSPEATPDTLMVRFVVKNPVQDPRVFCDYHTPFEGIRNDIFDVTDASGADVPYRGMMAKRAAPVAENYKEVAGRSYAFVDVDLKASYAFVPGQEYKVRFRGGNISGLPESNELVLKVPSP